MGVHDTVWEDRCLKPLTLIQIGIGPRSRSVFDDRFSESEQLGNVQMIRFQSGEFVLQLLYLPVQAGRLFSVCRLVQPRR